MQVEASLSYIMKLHLKTKQKKKIVNKGLERWLSEHPALAEDPNSLFSIDIRLQLQRSDALFCPPKAAYSCHTHDMKIPTHT